MILSKTIITVERTLQDVLDALQQRLTLAENFVATEVSATSPATPDEEFAVTHSLGKTPRHYIYNIDSAGIVYDSRRSEWTPNLIYLKCNVAGATIMLTIL